MINIIFALILSSSLFANSTLFHLPNLKANVAKLVEKKKLEAQPKVRYGELCDMTSMKGKEYMEILAYQEITGMDCWDLILEQSSEAVNSERLPATNTAE